MNVYVKDYLKERNGRMIRERERGGGSTAFRISRREHARPILLTTMPPHPPNVMIDENNGDGAF